jgi:divalent metal cation (Fe/Co/Zn/Cd) transporter
MAGISRYWIDHEPAQDGGTLFVPNSDLRRDRTKFAAAIWTGSPAMLSEGIHSVVDTGNELLLLYGFRRATVRADREHRLGYGREIYFWSFVVALLVFAVGAGFSFYDGIAHVMRPFKSLSLVA